MSTITVITQTTEERNQETREIFEQMKPLLDNGWNFTEAYKKASGKNSIGTMKRGAYRDIKEYAQTQGYNYKDYQWRRKQE